MSLLVLIVPSSAVGAPQVFQSFRAGIRWGVGSPLLDISLSDDPSIVSDASSSNHNLPLVPTEPPPSSTDTSNHKPNSSHCATSRDILWIDRYCSTRVGSVVRYSHRPPARVLEFSRLKLTVLHRLALEGTAAGRETQQGTTAIGCFRGPRPGVNITSERMLGVRGVSAAGCKGVCEGIALRSSLGCSEPDAWSLMIV